jgi:hypothetical protein
MAQQQPVARKQSRLKRDQQQEAESGADQNGHDEEVARYQEQLADYLQERIKPGLNRGAIPLLARSIAREVANWEAPNGSGSDDEEPEAEAQDEFEDGADAEPEAEADDETSGESDDESDGADDEDGEDDFEADMHDLQAELGEDWILRFSVHGDDAWLTAEKEDGSQRLEAPNASVILKAVKLLSKVSA